MISVYTGTPGSGKSLNAARELLRLAMLGRRIVANFAITPTKKQLKKGVAPEHWPNSKITPRDLLRYATQYHKYGKESQTTLVIDECQLIFNCRDFRANDRPEWIEFFSKHRKYGFDVILITQHDRLLDRQIRAFIEYEIKHRKLNRFGVPGMVLSLFRVPVFVAVTYWYGLRERCGAEFFRYRRKLGAVYDSYRDFSWVERGGEGAGNAGGDLSRLTSKEPKNETPPPKLVIDGVPFDG
ncbi:hypothetical protein FACS1894217_13500 [Clostridia bacterium]|nr:hypothetical protein FACS1894217_13500 [Clostridia bacterium]